MVLLHILSQPVPVKIDAASLRKTGCLARSMLSCSNRNTSKT